MAKKKTPTKKPTSNPGNKAVFIFLGIAVVVVISATALFTIFFGGGPVHEIDYSKTYLAIKGSKNIVSTSSSQCEDVTKNYNSGKVSKENFDSYVKKCKESLG